MCHFLSVQPELLSFHVFFRLRLKIQRFLVKRSTSWSLSGISILSSVIAVGMRGFCSASVYIMGFLPNAQFNVLFS